MPPVWCPKTGSRLVSLPFDFVICHWLDLVEPVLWLDFSRNWDLLTKNRHFETCWFYSDRKFTHCTMNHWDSVSYSIEAQQISGCEDLRSHFKKTSVPLINDFIGFAESCRDGIKGKRNCALLLALLSFAVHQFIIFECYSLLYL
jgi:hypothetical protein